MFRKIGLIFRAGWICTVVNTVATGINAASTVLVYIKDQISGSETGDNLIPRIDTVLEFLNTGKDVLNNVGVFVCGPSFTAQNTTLSVDDALAVLDRTTKELKTK
jgi:uncharacterized circularly permuted ATP-grasp superfamily protein